KQLLGQFRRSLFTDVQIDAADQYFGPFLSEALGEPVNSAMSGREVRRQGRLAEAERTTEGRHREQESVGVASRLPQVIAQCSGQQVERFDLAPSSAVPCLSGYRRCQRQQVNQSGNRPELLPHPPEQIRDGLRIRQVGA